MHQYLGYDCPICNSYCIYDNGDISDEDAVEFAKCWQCGCVVKLPEFDCDDPTVLDVDETIEKTFRFNGLNV